MATGLITVSAAQLQAAELPPLKFVVENFLPQGLTVLAALPKYGKSWFVLNLCITIATGQPFLNRNTTQGGCLYLSLKDSHRRLQDRLNKVLNGGQAPQNLDLSINAEGLSGKLIEDMEKYLKNKPDTSLIIIDTLQKIRDIPRVNNNIYFTDYADLSKLKTFADKYKICILLVHHLRKMTDSGDIFNQISGSTGLVHYQN